MDKDFLDITEICVSEEFPGVCQGNAQVIKFRYELLMNTFLRLFFLLNILFIIFFNLLHHLLLI